MRHVQLAVLALAGLLTMTPAAEAQRSSGRPYIGYVYPAGGQQGATFQVKLGGQSLGGVNSIVVSGGGIQVNLVDYLRKLGPQDMRLLSDQMKALKRDSRGKKLASKSSAASSADPMTMDSMTGVTPAPLAIPAAGVGDATAMIMARIQARMTEYVNKPACSSISTLVIAEVTIAPDAEPGPRELRLVTSQGVSNPLVFCVGQVPEVSRKAMLTSHFQVLGKEGLALRKRPDSEIEQRITLPCTANGQIASGEVNLYRFEARKGQRLVISAQARELIPYIADAVPGWFQPVLVLYDGGGKEVAYSDDYRFKPDPVIFFDVPQDGEYVLSVADAIYRGREDFVYRVTIGELPFVTSIFPLGGRVGTPVKIQMKGRNLPKGKLAPPPKDAEAGVHWLTTHNKGTVSNRVPFALDTLPEALENEPNNNRPHAQNVELPIIVNGRVDQPDDWDVFQFTGRARETVVVEAFARRLDSPLDSIIKFTDANGKVLAMNDDREDAESGLNTHHADSYLMTTLPADGTYYVHLGDAARKGGEEYAYRLRISAPQPSFALRVVPSSVALRAKSSAALSVYAIRKDGFTGPITLGLKDPPPGFSASSVTMAPDQVVTRLTIKAGSEETKKSSKRRNQPKRDEDTKSADQPEALSTDFVSLVIEGRAKTPDQEITAVAVPAEDKMQAFLWRHLVPAQELKALVVHSSNNAQPVRVRQTPAPESPASSSGEKAKFSKQQVGGRLRQLKVLFDEWLLTEDFYDQKVAECYSGR